MIAPDFLRPPSALDPSAAAYKDWLHLNVFDHGSGAIGLVTVSLNGEPTDPRSRAVGTALLHVPGTGWAGNVEVRGIGEAAIGPASVALPQVALAVDHASGTVSASALFPDDGFDLQLSARARTPAMAVERRIPFGSGWVSWYVVPHLAVQGEARVGRLRTDLSGASAYHDHNWGRWHWGDDVGWEWGVFVSSPRGPMFVLSRTTDRAHRAGDQPILVVHASGGRRTFGGSSVRISRAGTLEARPRRVPGAMAALHQDRARPRLPSTVTVRADVGGDRVALEFVSRASAQLVAADPTTPGYGFVHELVGEFRAEGRIGGGEIAAEGLGVFEHVD